MLSIKNVIRKYICNYYTALLLAFFVRVIWASLIPQLSNAPDEASHWLGVEYLSNNFSQPSAEEIINLKVGAHVLQIQMSYFHMVIPNIFFKLFTSNESILVYFSRIANALLSILVIVNCKLFFEKTLKDRVLANLLSLALAFHPQYVFISSYINNDIFTCWIATLSIIVISNFLQNDKNSSEIYSYTNQINDIPNPKWFLFITLFSSVFTKSSLIIYIAFILSLFMLLIARILININQNYFKNRLNHNLKISNYTDRTLFAVFSLISASILYFLYTIKLSIPGIKALNIFEGSLMSQVFVYPNLPKGGYVTIFSSHGIFSYLTTINEMGYWKLILQGFWGIFDNMSMKMSNIWYDLYLPFMIIFLCGLLSIIINFWKPNNLTLLESTMAIAVVLMCFGSLSFSYKIDYQPQGRHFLPMLVIFYYFVVRGLQLLRNKGVTRIAIMFLLTVSVVCSSFYIPLYLFKIYYKI